jgi:hypothetical protein
VVTCQDDDPPLLSEAKAMEILERLLGGTRWRYEPNKLEIWPSGGRVKLWHDDGRWDWVWWSGGADELEAEFRERMGLAANT